MRQLQPEPDANAGASGTSWTQLGLELAVFCGIALLLLVAAMRAPAGRTDVGIMLGIAVVLHATALVRLALRAADHLERDRAN